MHMLVFYVPVSHLEQVKKAVFDKGAGKLGDYDCCCWQVEGLGQYRPLENSKPFLGSHQVLSQEKEYRVEMLCEDHLLTTVIAALIAAHPYETPAFSAWSV